MAALDSTKPQWHPPRRGAEPFLASQLVEDAELEALYEGITSLGKTSPKRGEKRLRVGVESVDLAIEGGVESARLVGVSCELAGGLGGEICLMLLANSLLLDPSSSAAVIDTTGNVDILRLYTQIVRRLQSDASLLEKFPAQSEQVEDLAAKVLERVKIMRVFDLVGVMEAVEEIREGLDGKTTTTEAARRPELEVMRGDDQPVVEPVPASPPQRSRERVIADSEDEDEDMLSEEDQDSVHTSSRDGQSKDAGSYNPAQEQSGQDDGKVTFILIDNLAHVINPLLKKDYTHTNALAATLLLSLSNLTKAHNLHTILLNPSTQPRIPPPTTQPSAQKAYKPPPPPSIFTSKMLIPALVNILVPYLDLHLLVTQMPRRKADARVAYAEHGGEMGSSRVRGGKGPEMVGVVEVLADRWGARVGAWGSFGDGQVGIEAI